MESGTDKTDNERCKGIKKNYEVFSIVLSVMSSKLLISSLLAIVLINAIEGNLSITK